MTLAQALATLHRAGRIREVSLPGMLYLTTVEDEVERAMDGFDTLEDGMVEERFGKIKDEWWDDDGWRFHAPSPDTTDPATVGCLLALVREAAGDSSIAIGRRTVGPDDVLVWAPFTFDAHWEKDCVLCVNQSGEVTTSGRVLHAQTEGEAIAVTLVALAGAT